MKMQHVTIQTRYFDEEIKFYERYAGLKIIGDMRPMMDLVFLAEEEGDTKVEIIGNHGAERSGNENISIGFATSDASLLAEDFIIAGLVPTDIISPDPGVEFFFVEDPAGVKVQFIEEHHGKR
jgi:lactoylglutathione lyase